MRWEIALTIIAYTNTDRPTCIMCVVCLRTHHTHRFMVPVTWLGKYGLKKDRYIYRYLGRVCSRTYYVTSWDLRETISQNRKVLMELLKVSLSLWEDNVGEESTVAVSQEEEGVLYSFFTLSQYLHSKQRKAMQIPMSLRPWPELHINSGLHLLPTHLLSASSNQSTQQR